LAFQSYLTDSHWGQFLGFWACCCQATFSYCGAELIGIAAEETERQRKNIPRLVRRVSYRLTFYYTAAVFMLGLNVQANDPVLRDELSSGQGYFSPFILMVERAGIAGLGHVINAVALIASVSVANANLYLSV
jgi:yeast amino acid transporter